MGESLIARVPAVTVPPVSKTKTTTRKMMPDHSPVQRRPLPGTNVSHYSSEDLDKLDPTVVLVDDDEDLWTCRRGERGISRRRWRSTYHSTTLSETHTPQSYNSSKLVVVGYTNDALNRRMAQAKALLQFIVSCPGEFINGAGTTLDEVVHGVVASLLEETSDE